MADTSTNSGRLFVPPTQHYNYGSTASQERWDAESWDRWERQQKKEKELLYTFCFIFLLLIVLGIYIYRERSTIGMWIHCVLNYITPPIVRLGKGLVAERIPILLVILITVIFFKDTKPQSNYYSSGISSGTVIDVNVKQVADEELYIGSTGISGTPRYMEMLGLKRKRTVWHESDGGVLDPFPKGSKYSTQELYPEPFYWGLSTPVKEPLTFP